MKKGSVLFTLGLLSILCYVRCDNFLGIRHHDKVEIIQEEKSPNGQYVATSFSCSGGGAAGYFYFNANLHKAGEELDQLDVLIGKHKDWKVFFDVRGVLDRRRQPRGLLQRDQFARLHG
jgi:hypothetical protein